MYQVIIEWVGAVLLLTSIVSLFAFGGVLITAAAIVSFSVLMLLVFAELILSPFKWAVSLFRRGAKRLDGKRREG